MGGKRGTIKETPEISLQKCSEVSVCSVTSVTRILDVPVALIIVRKRDREGESKT